SAPWHKLLKWRAFLASQGGRRRVWRVSSHPGRRSSRGRSAESAINDEPAGSMKGGHPLMKERPMSVSTEQKRQEGGFAETVRVIFHALVIALVIRTFLFQPFNIPSGSMKATLLVNDYLFVSKYTYGYSHYSLPFSPPLFSGRILGSEPK